MFFCLDNIFSGIWNYMNSKKYTVNIFVGKQLRVEIIIMTCSNSLIKIIFVFIAPKKTKVNWIQECAIWVIEHDLI